MNLRFVEGVPYRRFVVRYTLVSGAATRRLRMVRWSPGFPWVRDEVARELDARFGVKAIKPGSVTIREACS